MEKRNETNSDNFYQRKIAVLEQELAEKTRILANTSSALSDSQKQYQNLLRKLEKMKKETAHDFFMKPNYQKFDSDFIISSMKSRERNSSFGQPLQQLQDFEETVKQLTFQMNQLKTQNYYLKNEQNEWKNFSISIFHKIQNILNIDQDIPENDSEAQRFIIDDLFDKLYFNWQKNQDEENIYKDKYNKAKLKLCEVQKKCDKMLNLLEENGVELNSFRSHHYQGSIDNKKHSFQAKRKYIEQREEDNLNINELGNHLDQLSSITQKMKKHYKTIKELTE